MAQTDAKLLHLGPMAIRTSVLPGVYARPILSLVVRKAKMHFLPPLGHSSLLGPVAGIEILFF